MKKVETNRDAREGSALVLTLIFIAVGAVLAGGILNSSTSHRYVASDQVEMERATYVAEAGLEAAGQMLADNNGFMPNAVTTVTSNFAGGSFSATITEEAGWKNFSISVNGTADGVARNITVDRAYFPTFANFAMWSVVNGVIYYFPGEQFNGLIHSDDKLWFSSSATYGGPLFQDKVTSGNSTYGGSTNYVDFMGGFDLNVENGELADVDFDFLEYRAGNSTGNIRLEGRTEIEFDGANMIISNSRMGWNDEVVPIQPNQLVYVADSTYGSSYSRSGKVDLEGGYVDGRVSIVSENDMYIHGHLRYANDPTDDGINDPYDPTDDDYSDDALGLISKDDIWVDYDAPNNLDLQGAILATGQRPNNPGSFGVLGWNSGSSRGDLNLYGSLVQEQRGYVNTSWGNGSIATGYRKMYNYDTRFADASPPYYPEIGNQIKFVGWKDGPV